MNHLLVSVKWWNALNLKMIFDFNRWLSIDVLPSCYVLYFKAIHQSIKAHSLQKTSTRVGHAITYFRLKNSSINFCWDFFQLLGQIKNRDASTEFLMSSKTIRCHNGLTARQEPGQWSDSASLQPLIKFILWFAFLLSFYFS